MRADIAEAARAEKRVADAMAQDVAIRMADGPFLEWQLDAANNELAAFRKTVEVVSNSRSSQLTHPATSFLFKFAFSQRRFVAS
jgi:hypothetical protein